MKTINKSLLLIITGLLSLSWVNAEYRIYDNMEDFENAKWSVCEAATDGCNNYFMWDGKVLGGTLMACPAEQKIEWTCTKYKDDVMTTKMLPTTTNHEMVENMESNSGLSDNDLSFYNTIKDRLDIKYQNAINKIIVDLEVKLSKYTQVRQDKIKNLIADKLESKISHLLLQYPQDIALPKSVNNKYLAYTLLKFELIK